MEFAFPHKYIKNTSINGTVLTGYLLNTSRRPWIPKRIGKKKKKTCNNIRWRKEVGRDQDLTESWKWGEIPSFREILSQWGNQLGERQSFKGSEGNAAVCVRKDRVRSVYVACAAALCIPAWVVCLLVWRGLGAGKWSLEGGPGRG